MPFSTDTNWLPGLLNFFNISRNQKLPPESRYYGPYDRLFNYALIEGSFTFSLTPQIEPEEMSAPHDVADSVELFVILNQVQKPVLIVDIQDDSWVNKPYTRQRANIRMCRWYNEMLYDCPIPRLYGLSLFGTSLRACLLW